MNIPKYLIVHHSGGTDANPLQDSSNYTVEMCDRDHKERFNMQSVTGHWCGYHAFINKFGLLTITRLDTEVGAHTIGHNLESLGICIAGNFDQALPTSAQITTLKNWLIAKKAQYNILDENIVPHRKFSPKTCYGNNLSDDWARKLLPVAPVVDNGPTIQKVAALLDQAKALLATIK